MASADTRDDSEPLLTIEVVKPIQDVFAKEAITFLLDNAHIWIEYPKDFVTRFKCSKKNTQFLDCMANAIVIIAYLHRMEYRARYRQPVNLETDLSLYEDCVRSYSFPKEKFFYHYLAWTAFIFDLTMYCYKKGYDYTKRGEQFIGEYPDIDGFTSILGPYYHLINNSTYIERKYRKAAPKTRNEKFKDEDIKSFIKRLENIERRDRYSNNSWKFQANKEKIRKIMSNLSRKYVLVSAHDSRRVTSGYRIVLKKSTEKSTQKISPNSSKVQVSKFNSGEKDDLGKDFTSQKDKTISEGITADCNFAASKMESSYSWDIDNSNSVFIISQRFLGKREESRKDPNYKRGLKIYSPLMNNDVLALNLNEVLDENIDNRNYIKKSKGVCAVASKPAVGRIIGEKDHLIVLDTSSEEEDDCSCIKSPYEIADIIFPGYFKPNNKVDVVSEELFERVPSKRTESESEESVSGMTTEQKSEQSKISEAKSIESTSRILDKEISTKIPFEQRILVSSKSTKAVSKESGTVVHPEQKPFAITKSTGAIPKVRKTDLKRRPTKRPHTDNASMDSEDSDQNNA